MLSLDALSKAYGIKFTKIDINTDKTYLLLDNYNNQYILKQTTKYIFNKYTFLHSYKLANIIFPYETITKTFLYENNNTYYILIKKYPDIELDNKIKLNYLINELEKLHSITTKTKKLSKEKAKEKMDQLFEFLDYKFTALELFIRYTETSDYNEYSNLILNNYQYILKAKEYLLKAFKNIIKDIKDEKEVLTCFVHNNPRLDHLINNYYSFYFISLEKSLYGICSLDIAKFYLLNEHLECDFKTIINNYFSNFSDSFYKDYFVFLVLLYYIKSLIHDEINYVSALSFNQIGYLIKRFLYNFG